MKVCGQVNTPTTNNTPIPCDKFTSAECIIYMDPIPYFGYTDPTPTDDLFATIIQSLGDARSRIVILESGGIENPDHGDLEGLGDDDHLQYLTTQRGLDLILSGLNTNLTGEIEDTDSLINAFGKLQNQVSEKEPNLGNPSTNGQVLTSTTAGVRSWTNIPGGADNLGNHTATQRLDMNNFNIDDTGNIKPEGNGLYSLGSNTNKFAHLYVEYINLYGASASTRWLMGMSGSKMSFNLFGTIGKEYHLNETGIPSDDNDITTVKYVQDYVAANSGGTDDQDASEVPVSPAVNSLTNVQSVLEDHESRIDTLSSGGADGLGANGDKGFFTVTGANSATLNNNAIGSSHLADNSITTDKVNGGAITNSKLANVASGTIKGRVTASAGSPEDLTTTQVTAMLNPFTTTLKGLVPSPTTVTGKLLSDNGTWVTPSTSSGDVSKVGTPVNNQLAVWTGDGTLEGDSKLTYDNIQLKITSSASNTDVFYVNSQDGDMLGKIRESAFGGEFHFGRADGTSGIILRGDGITYIGGDVGIGNTTPSEKLDVVGNVKATAYKVTGQTDASNLLAGDGTLVAVSSLGGGSGDMLKSENLSGLANNATALSNLGFTATLAELNYTDGVTSNIQTQLNSKGTGNVTKVGTPTANYLPLWTGDGTIKSQSDLLWVDDSQYAILRSQNGKGFLLGNSANSGLQSTIRLGRLNNTEGTLITGGNGSVASSITLTNTGISAQLTLAQITNTGGASLITKQYADLNYSGGSGDFKADGSVDVTGDFNMNTYGLVDTYDVYFTDRASNSKTWSIKETETTNYEGDFAFESNNTGIAYIAEDGVINQNLHLTTKAYVDSVAVGGISTDNQNKINNAFLPPKTLDKNADFNLALSDSYNNTTSNTDIGRKYVMEVNDGGTTIVTVPDVGSKDDVWRFRTDTTSDQLDIIPDTGVTLDWEGRTTENAARIVDIKGGLIYMRKKGTNSYFLDGDITGFAYTAPGTALPTSAYPSANSANTGANEVNGVGGFDAGTAWVNATSQSTGAYDGGFFIRLNNDGSSTLFDTCRHQIPLAVGTYNVSMWLKSSTGITPTTFTVREYGVDDGTIINVNYPVGLSTTWTEVTFTKTVGAGQTGMDIRIGCNDGEILDVDGIVINLI